MTSKMDEISEKVDRLLLYNCDSQEWIVEGYGRNIERIKQVDFIGSESGYTKLYHKVNSNQNSNKIEELEDKLNEYIERAEAWFVFTETLIAIQKSLLRNLKKKKILDLKSFSRKRKRNKWILSL